MCAGRVRSNRATTNFYAKMTTALTINKPILKVLCLESYVKNFTVGGGRKNLQSLKNNFVYVKTANYCEGVVYKISCIE